MNNFENREAALALADKWFEAFHKSPRFAGLTDSQRRKASAITGFFAQHAFDYLGLTPDKWDEAAVGECLTEIFPRKVSAEPAFFEATAPVLIAFFTFLSETALLSEGLGLAQTAQTVQDEALAAVGDRSNWGPAKSFVMAALESGVDVRNADALRAFALEFNLRQMAHSAGPNRPAASAQHDFPRAPRSGR